MLVKENLGVNNLFVIYKCSKNDKKCLGGIHLVLNFCLEMKVSKKKKEMTGNGWLGIQICKFRTNFKITI